VPSGKPLEDERAEGWPFWAPSDEATVDAAFDLAGLRPGDRLADLGCGDGHVLVRAAQRGADVVGIETDPDLAEHARDALAAAGLAGQVVVGDLLAFALDDVDVVFTYLSPVTLQRLVPRLRGARPGTRVVTIDFAVPGLQPERVDGMCHLYRLPAAPLPPERPGWPTAGVLVAAPPEVESLTSLLVWYDGGPVGVAAAPTLATAAAVRVGTDVADEGDEVAVDLRWRELPAGTAVDGWLRSAGHRLDVFTLVTRDEHGQWELDAGAVDRVRSRLAAGSLPPSFADLLAVAEGS
jgi:SAM-dependent methyltransferase